MVKECLICGKIFHTYNSEIKKGGGKYCSRECYFESIKGAKNSKWKGGISKVVNNCELCGKETSDYRNKRCYKCALIGRKLSEEHKRNISRKVNIRRGEDSNFWNGGVSSLQRLIRSSVYNKKWRTEVFERDNWTCQECSARSKKGHRVIIEAHHKESFSDIFNRFIEKYNQFSVMEDKETLARLSESYTDFWDINNGETLCRDCHDKTKVGGKA